MRRREFMAGVGAAAWPMVARAQQQAMPVIGFISGGSADALRNYAAAFQKGLGGGPIDAKAVEMLRALVPAAASLGLLVNPTSVLARFPGAGGSTCLAMGISGVRSEHR